MADSQATRYNDTVLEHFRHPRNAGAVDDADGIGRVGDPACGDYLEVQIKVEGNCLTAVRFLCRGCPAAIACASVMTELATGCDLDEAAEVTDEVVEDALGGLPADKRHCSNLAAAALGEAVFDHIVRGLRRGDASTDARPPRPAAEGGDKGGG